jgi:hypothetical protein
MPELIIKLDGDGIVKDFPPDQVIFIESPVVLTSLPKGMSSGLPSVSFIADLPDGRKVIIQTSAKLLILAAIALRAK